MRMVNNGGTLQIELDTRMDRYVTLAQYSVGETAICISNFTVEEIAAMRKALDGVEAYINKLDGVKK